MSSPCLLQPEADPSADGIRALCFDVFGTVVDWRSSIVREGRVLFDRLQLGAIDWEVFADDWRAGYAPAMQQVRSGALPWTDLDGLHRRILERLLAERQRVLDEADVVNLNRVWHRLAPWADSVSGLTRLKARTTITTLSNGHVALLLNMAKHAGLPWDTVLSAELFAHYKPDPEVYLGAARLLGLAPHQVMMVAAHPSDLRAAAACGLRTAYVDRPLERGAAGAREIWTPGEFDVAAIDVVDLADRLGA